MSLWYPCSFWWEPSFLRLPWIAAVSLQSHLAIQSIGFSPAAAAGSLLEIQILRHHPSTFGLSRSADDEWVRKSEKCCLEPPPAAF